MESNDLSYLRKKFLPVYDHEIKKIIPLIFMMGLITYIYSSLRVLKDAYVISLAGIAGITTAKILVMLLLVPTKLIYDAIAKRINPYYRMFLFVGYFMTYFVSFYVWFIVAKPTKIDEDYEQYLSGLDRWAYFGETWPYFLFYIHAEFVGTFMLSVGFWGFLNLITSNEQAKRCYPSLSLGSAISTLLAGVIGLLTAPSLSEKPETMKSPTLLLFIIVGILILGVLYYWFIRKLSKDPAAYEVPEEVKKKKKKLGMVAAIKAFFRSSQTSYIMLICIIIAGYNLGINLFEMIVKSFYKVYAKKQDYQADAFIHRVGSWQLVFIGIASLIVVLFLVAPSRKRSWRFNALIVPTIFLTGSLCCLGYIAYHGVEALNNDLPLSLIMLGVAILVFIKSTKYVFFDSTTAFLYKQLPADDQLTAQSFGNGVVARGAKGSGALTGTFGFKPYLNRCYAKGAPMFFLTWLIGPMVLVCLLSWILACLRVDKRCQALIKQNEETILEKEKEGTEAVDEKE